MKKIVEAVVTIWYIKNLRPWVKLSIMFLLGVFVVSKIFSLGDASATEEKNSTEVVHGVISLQYNGDVHLKIIDGNYSDVKLDWEYGYELCEIITVEFSGDDIINHYRTTGDELQELLDNRNETILEYRTGIMQSNFE